MDIISLTALSTPISEKYIRRIYETMAFEDYSVDYLIQKTSEGLLNAIFVTETGAELGGYGLVEKRGEVYFDLDGKIETLQMYFSNGRHTYSVSVSDEN